ncbi:MAG: hypothetical protein Q8P12_03545 [bacterium]|nr:hypothetical protein [bacterium]
MAQRYSPAQLDKMMEKLPEELKEALFSPETAEEVGETCESYGIADNRVWEVSDRVRDVLMGILLPQEFAGVLEQEIKIPKALAEAIARDLNRLIFYPVKPALEQLHRMEIEVSAKVVTPKAGKEEETAQEEPSQKKPPEKSSGPDTYQEPIE